MKFQNKCVNWRLVSENKTIKTCAHIHFQKYYRELHLIRLHNKSGHFRKSLTIRYELHRALISNASQPFPLLVRTTID